MINMLSIDIETFSSEDLSRAGVYRYAEAPDFRVLLFGYRIDDAPVKVCKIAAICSFKSCIGNREGQAATAN